MTASGNILAQNTTEDSLRIDSLKTELAEVQYKTIQVDSLLQIQYSILDDNKEQILLFRNEINAYIDEKAVAGELALKDARELIKINNKLAKIKGKNLKWFGIGAATGGGAVLLFESIGLIIGLTSK